MPSVKQQVKELVDALPDDVTLEDIQYQLYVQQKVEHARRDIQAGRTVGADDVRERMSRWTDPSAGHKSP